jgi:hypothetical protein
MTDHPNVIDNLKRLIEKTEKKGRPKIHIMRWMGDVIRFSIDHKLTIQISPDLSEWLTKFKKIIIRLILSDIKDGYTINARCTVNILLKLGLDWPEINIIKRSIEADMIKDQPTINESISNNPNINAQIEKVLDGFSHIDQTHILDALEILQDAGQIGLSPTQWSESMKKLYPENDFSVIEILKTTVKQFPFCVKRTGDKNYIWSDTISPETKDAVSKQVKMTYAGLDLMKQLGTFTIADLATKLATRFQMPTELANKFADHLVHSTGSKNVIELGDGKFRIVQDNQANDYSDQIANLLKNAGLTLPD